MEQNEEKEHEEAPELVEIANEIEKLTEEVQIAKESKRRRERLEKSENSRRKKPIEINPAIEYISDLLENSSEQIVSEMKSEFFRLFNFLSSMFSVSPNHADKRYTSRNDTLVSGDGLAGSITDQTTPPTSTEREKMLKLLLDERESLIYELSDQIVAIEAEKKIIQDKIKQINEEKIKWTNQKTVLERLVTTDPRFNVINLLRRMGVIAPIQLSFVLGVSLSQTKKYIQELEGMKILKENEDGTVSLHPEFSEETMDIKIENDK